MVYAFSFWERRTVRSLAILGILALCSCSLSGSGGGSNDGGTSDGNAPVITSAAKGYFTEGIAGTFAITATGNPVPTITCTGSLPQDVTYNSSTHLLNGTPAAGTKGSYPLSVTARNGVSPDATQAFTLVVVTSGTLDETFGTGGKVTTSFGTNHDEIDCLAIQQDGKILAAGSSYIGSYYDFALARYNTDGTLDASFGTSGKVTTPIGTQSDNAYGIALQTDGKIVVAGSATTSFNSDFALVRYNTNGTLDTSFGTGGKVTTPIGSAADTANAVALQADGKLVVAGYSNNGTYNDFALVRYNSDGNLDSTFGTGGKVTTPVDSGHSYAYGIVIQQDGKIVLAGYSYNSSNEDFALVRYNTNGTLDTTFGTNGKVVTQIGTYHESAHGIAIQSNGEIVVGGYILPSSSSYKDFALTRYWP